MTKLEEIKRCRENAIDIEEYFGRLIDWDKEMLNLEDEWESSYWKFYVKIKSIEHYIERLYEKERSKNKKEKEFDFNDAPTIGLKRSRNGERKTGNQPKDGTS